MLGRSPRVLIVEQDALLGDSLEVAFDRAGYQALSVAGDADVIRAAAEFKPDVVVIEVLLTTRRGYMLAAELKQLRPAPYIIMFTAMSRGDAERLARSLGVDYVVHKPAPIQYLLNVLGAVVRPAAAAA